MSERPPRAGEVLKDKQGNHFIVLKSTSDKVTAESVATREVFSIPVSELCRSGRVVF